MSILITGASGCLGSYLIERFLAEEKALEGKELIAWVRDPQRLPAPFRSHPRLTLWQGGLERHADYAQELLQVESLIHPATAWGGPETYRVNVQLLRQVLKQLAQGACQQFHYFSSASILNAQHELQRAALHWGSDYIRSKAAMHLHLQSQSYPFKVSTYYPTVILGGNDIHRWTPLTAGLKALPRYLPWARRLRVSGGFHCIHARDIADIVFARWQEQAQGRDIVLGNEWHELNSLLQSLSEAYGLPQPSQLKTLDVDRWAHVLLWLLRPWMSEWDRFSFRERQIRYQAARSVDFGRPSVGESLLEILRFQGLLPDERV